MKKSILNVFVFLLVSSLCSCKNEPSNNEDIVSKDSIDATLASDFSVSKVFSDHMVLQRNENIRIWGFANDTENNKKVTADFMGMHKESLIKKGKWEIIFPSINEANKNGNTLTVNGDNLSYSFTDVLIGDVYMVVGQSNVAYSVNDYLSYAISDDNEKENSTINLYKVTTICLQIILF